MMEIRVSSSAGDYPVKFTPLTDLWAGLNHPVVVTDENVRHAWGHVVPDGIPVYSVPAGEASKSVGEYERLLRRLAQDRVSRSATLVALGGGVVGDLAGFAAATYMRGLDYLQAPTSLLAMVDSSVGGKVGIDLPEGKNLVGAFYPPKAVVVCMETLATLPDRHLANGMAEVWKYAFLGNAELLDLLQAYPVDLASAVHSCIRQKAGIVERDEFDRSGIRATLNFGHTVGHALEAHLAYEELLHGEAVAIGMAAEAHIGEAAGFTESGTAGQVEEWLRSSGLPTRHPALRDQDALLDRMRLDKKAEPGQLAFSLLKRIGECKLVSDVPVEAVRAGLRIACSA